MGDFQRFRFAADDAVAAGSGGHSRLFHGLAGNRLVAEGAHRFRRRPDEGDAVLAAGFGEVGVFGQEAVAGMDRIHIADRRHRQNPIDQQITRRRLRGPDADRFVGHFDREALRIGLRIDRHGADSQFAAGPDHPDCDFAAVGDENFIEHMIRLCFFCNIEFTRSPAAAGHTRPAGRFPPESL